MLSVSPHTSQWTLSPKTGRKCNGSTAARVLQWWTKTGPFIPQTAVLPPEPIMFATNVCKVACQPSPWRISRHSSARAAENRHLMQHLVESTPDPNLAWFNADDEPMCPCRLMLSDTLNGRSRSNLILCLLIIVRQSIFTTQRHRNKYTAVPYIQQVGAGSEVNYRSEHC